MGDMVRFSWKGERDEREIILYILYMIYIIMYCSFLDIISFDFTAVSSKVSEKREVIQWVPNALQARWQICCPYTAKICTVLQHGWVVTSYACWKMCPKFVPNQSPIEMEGKQHLGLWFRRQLHPRGLVRVSFIMPVMPVQGDWRRWALLVLRFLGFVPRPQADSLSTRA